MITFVVGENRSGDRIHHPAFRKFKQISLEIMNNNLICLVSVYPPVPPYHHAQLTFLAMTLYKNTNCYRYLKKECRFHYIFYISNIFSTLNISFTIILKINIVLTNIHILYIGVFESCSLEGQQLVRQQNIGHS